VPRRGQSIPSWASALLTLAQADEVIELRPTSALKRPGHHSGPLLARSDGSSRAKRGPEHVPAKAASGRIESPYFFVMAGLTQPSGAASRDPPGQVRGLRIPEVGLTRSMIQSDSTPFRASPAADRDRCRATAIAVATCELGASVLDGQFGGGSPPVRQMPKLCTTRRARSALPWIASAASLSSIRTSGPGPRARPVCLPCLRRRSLSRPKKRQAAGLGHIAAERRCPHDNAPGTIHAEPNAAASLD